MRKDGALSRAPARTTVQRLGVAPPRVAGLSLARRRFHASRLEERALAAAGPSGPSGIGRMLDQACEALARRFSACFGVCAALWFPTLVLESTLLRGGTGGDFVFWSMASESVVRFVCVAFVTSLVGGELLGRPQPAGAALYAGLARLPGLLVLGVLTGAVTLVGMICCFVPGLIASWLFWVVPSVYVLEKVGALRAIGRGVRLMTDGGTFLRWAGTFACAHLVLLPFYFVEWGLSALPLRARIEELAGISGPALDLCVASIGTPYAAATSAFLAVVQTVLYVDVRVRREGLDLELRLAERAARAQDALERVA